MLMNHGQKRKSGGLSLGHNLLLQVFFGHVTNGKQRRATERRNREHERKHEFGAEPEVGGSDWCQRHCKRERRACLNCPFERWIPHTHSSFGHRLRKWPSGTFT